MPKKPTTSTSSRGRSTPTKSKRSTTTRLRSLEVLTLGQMLVACCRRDNGFAVYKDGFSDGKVLEEFQMTAPERGYKLDHIIRMRRKMFGDIQTRVDFLNPRDADGKIVSGKVVITGALFGEIIKLHQKLTDLIDSAARA